MLWPLFLCASQKNPPRDPTSGGHHEEEGSNRQRDRHHSRRSHASACCRPFSPPIHQGSGCCRAHLQLDRFLHWRSHRRGPSLFYPGQGPPPAPFLFSSPREGAPPPLS